MPDPPLFGMPGSSVQNLIDMLDVVSRMSSVLVSLDGDLSMCVAVCEHMQHMWTQGNSTV